MAYSRGDTLVEVLMSMVVLSLVVVGSITLMARGLASDELAVEHTQVRYWMSGQTEMLRYLRDGYSQNPGGSSGLTWSALFTGAAPYADTTKSAYSGASCNVTSSPAPKVGFYLTDPQPAGVVNLNTFNPAVVPATFATPGNGMWVEATRSNGVTPAYVDFEVRACWNGPISSTKQQEVTVMRLYDPAH